MFGILCLAPRGSRSHHAYIRVSNKGRDIVLPAPHPTVHPRIGHILCLGYRRLYSASFLALGGPVENGCGVPSLVSM